MAISVPIPKDLGKVKTKFVGGFTRRQVICFALALVAGVPLYFLLRKPLGTEAALIIMMIVMMPFFVCALYEKNGVPAEKLLVMMIRFKLAKPIRPYRAVNIFSQLEERDKKRKEVRRLENKRKEAGGPFRQSHKVLHRTDTKGKPEASKTKERPAAKKKG